MGIWRYAELEIGSSRTAWRHEAGSTQEWPYDPRDPVALLDRVGADGWGLVGMKYEPVTTNSYVFKRPVGK